MLFVCASLCACHTSKSVLQPEALAHAHDTLYINKAVYDSIYIDNWYCVEHKADTIFVDKQHTEYRYHVLRDTIREVRVDSIPVVREVYLPPKQGDRGGLPWWSKCLSWVGAISLFVLFVKFVVKKYLP